MSLKIKLKSYSDGELILSEEYEGTCERKGRYLRYEYKDKDGAFTRMIVCFDDSGLYRLESEGERKLAITCGFGGAGRVILTIGAHSMDGAISKFRSEITKTADGYKTQMSYNISFAKEQITRTRIIIEAKE